MKTRIRIGFLLLSICMIFALTCVINVSAEETTNVALTVSKSEVNVGDAVTVVIENKLMTVSGFGVYLSYDNTMLECTSVKGADDDEYLGLYKTTGKSRWVDAQVGNNVDSTNVDGIFSFGVVIGSDTEFEAGKVATLTFVAKAAGEVTFTLNEQTSGTDAFKDVAATQTLTIKSAAPEKYTVTVDLAEKITTLEVEAGAKLTEVLKDVKVPTIYNPNGWTCKMEHDGTWALDGITIGDDDVMPDKDITISANYYYTGWILVEGGWYYDIKNVTQKTGWTLISEADYTENGTGSAWYYLDPNTGYRAEGATRVPYPEYEINEVKYAPNADDLAYYNANKDNATDPSKYSDAETAVFVFGEDGKFDQTTGIVDGNRYAVNGMIAWHVGMVKVGDDYYYFKGDENVGGNIMTTGKVYATRDYNSDLAVKSGDNDAWKIYYFGEDGKLLKYDGIAKIGEASYYFENYSHELGKGIVKIESGEYIYVSSNGALAVDQQRWVTITNGYDIKPGKLYTFDENGYLENVIDPNKNGIYLEDGSYYYYVDGEREYAGAIRYSGEASDGTVYNNDIIYVTSSGKLATGEYWPSKTNDLLESGWHTFDENGRYYSAD